MQKLSRIQSDHLKGQATTEYILILAFAVSFAALLYSSFVKPQFENLKKGIALKVSESFKGDLHRLPPGLMPKKN